MRLVISFGEAFGEACNQFLVRLVISFGETCYKATTLFVGITYDI